MSEEIKNTFQILNDINVSDKLADKMNLKYLSWANAWGYLKSVYPDAFWTVYHRTITTTEEKKITDPNGIETIIKTSSSNDVPYFTDGKTCFVKVGVTIGDKEEVEELPVMDNRNNAVALSAVTMTLVNKAVQRAFVKACARHGLGLYIYAGEDLPDVDKKPPVDYKAMADEVTNGSFNPLSAEQFGVLQEKVINAIRNMDYDQNITNIIVNFISATTDKKLSQLTLEDSIALQKIDLFLSKVAASLN